MGYLSILTPRQHDSHWDDSVQACCGRVYTSQASPLPFCFHNHLCILFYRRAQPVIHTNYLAIRPSLPSSLQHSWNSQEIGRVQQLDCTPQYSVTGSRSVTCIHTQVQKSPVYRVTHCRIWFVWLLVNLPPYYHSLLHHFVEFTGEWQAWRKFWCQLSDENPMSSPGHLPHPHSTAHFYQALKPKVKVVLP